MANRLVLFDFDGTLTRRDSMLAFVAWYKGLFRFGLGMLWLGPMFVRYKIGMIPNDRAKEHFLAHFFKGEAVERFRARGRVFAEEVIPKMLRPKVWERLQAHRAKGDQVAIVSASAECWLSGWCEAEGVTLLSSRLEVREGKITGKLDGPNCYGPEKVRRVKEAFELKNFDEIIVFGEGQGDADLLQLADRPFSPHHLK